MAPKRQRLGADHRRLHADPRRGRATANHDGIAPNPIGSDARDIGGRPADVAGEKFVVRFGRQTGWTIETRRSYRAGIRGSFRWPYRTKRVPDHLADELPKVREQRGRRGRARPPMKLFCLTSGMSSTSTGTICSVRSVRALHTTHCRPNVTFRIGLSGNNLWKQSKQIFWLIRSDLSGRGPGIVRGS